MKTGIILSAISSIMLALHFLREGNIILFLISLLFPFLLLIRSKWAKIIFSAFLFAGTAIWAYTAYEITAYRIQNAMPWLRAGIIIAVVTIFTFISSIAVLRIKR